MRGHLLPQWQRRLSLTMSTSSMYLLVNLYRSVRRVLMKLDFSSSTASLGRVGITNTQHSEELMKPDGRRGWLTMWHAVFHWQELTDKQLSWWITTFYCAVCCGKSGNPTPLCNIADWDVKECSLSIICWGCISSEDFHHQPSALVIVLSCHDAMTLTDKL